jgi:hypothetical protein
VSIRKHVKSQAVFLKPQKRFFSEQYFRTFLDEVWVELLVPAAVQQEAKIVHL